MYKCGASKVRITPSEDLMPDLYALMGKKFAGVIEDIHVRVLAVSNGNECALFVSEELDKSLCEDQVIPELSSRFRVPKENIFCFGIHTHTAPLHGDRIHEGPNGKAFKTEAEIAATNKYEAFVMECIYQAAKEAIDNMVPARLGLGFGKSYVGENRCQDYMVETENGLDIRVGLGSNPEGDCDPTLYVLKAETLEGEPIAFLINHAVHCCVMILNDFDGKGNIGISPDLAGAVSNLVEEKFPGAVALWSSGAAGNINPRLMNQFNFPNCKDGSADELQCAMSSTDAGLLLAILGHRQANDVINTVRTITCNMADGEIKGADKLVTCPGREGDYEVMLKGLKIGNLAFVGASGELYNSLGEIIKKEGLAAGFAHESGKSSVAVINHEGSLLYNSGYIFDDATLLRCLQPDGSYKGDLPGMRGLNMLIGSFEPALKLGSREIFEKLK